MYHSDYDVNERTQFEQSYDPCFKEAVETAIIAGLDHMRKFKGTFFYQATTSTAPNPGLNVQGCGQVGLPLSTDAARKLIESCEQAPFGKGERTVVDRDVRDTWQVDAEKVQFMNPVWQDFVQRSVDGVCTTLGVKAHSIGLRHELYKLLVYEEGSHFLPHVDTEKEVGMFATMIIVLPSFFEGGAVHLTHNNESKVIDVGGSLSAFQTSVLAWYTDIMHEVKPITSGYRLALSYNLIRSNSLAPLPMPSMPDPSIGALTESLSEWLDALEEGEDAPTKLAWLLDHQYSRMNMRLSALKGQDMALVKRLIPIAKDLKLQLGFAIVSMVVTSELPDEHDGLDWYTEEPELVDFGPPADYDSCSPRGLKFLVDLEGRVVCDTPSFSRGLEGEMMPEGWDERLAEEEADRQEYQGYTGNEAGSVIHWYRRTALVIWPEDEEL